MAWGVNAETRRAALLAAATVHSTAMGLASPQQILRLADLFVVWLEQEEPNRTLV
jgi:hypothetical protein